MALPIVGIICCHWQIKDERYFHLAGDQYVDAVSRGVNAFPLLIPAIEAKLPVQQVLKTLDGILFTGSPSNIEPHHYGASPITGDFNDQARDATSLPLIRAAIEQGVPILGICRGFQEMNVAFGGSLWQKVHEQADMMDHREQGDDTDSRYSRIAHPVHFTSGGLLEQIAGQESAEVNSLHHQGIRELAPNLIAEAKAPDGLVEAFRVANSPAFSLAVQWHPEWRFQEKPLSMAIFNAFGDACRQRQQSRND